MHEDYFVVGVDGGGTKTVAALATLGGEIVRKISGASSNVMKVGFEVAVFRLGKMLSALLRGIPRKKIKVVYLALAGFLERDYQKRGKIRNALWARFPKLGLPVRKVIIEGDQVAAFRSGSEEKNGVVLIAGTGSIAMGWNGKREAIAGGWDYIAGDQGSAFWVGQQVLRAICEELDGRRRKMRFLTQAVLSYWNMKKSLKNSSSVARKIAQRVYGPHTVETVASLAVVADKAAQKGDTIARAILREAGNQLSHAAETVIKELRFEKKRFPLVLVGGMFNSQIVLQTVKKNLTKVAPGVCYLRPRREPVEGAVSVALDFATNTRKPQRF